MSFDKVTTTLSATLSPIAGTYRRRIRSAFLAEHGPGPLNDERRLALETAIFRVQDDLEHRSPRHPMVATMNAIRNVLLDDVGSRTPGAIVDAGNEVARVGMRWPQVERMAEQIRASKRTRAPRSSDFGRSCSSELA